MRGGFTLFETLVVVAIAAMISGLAISYSSSIQRQLDLYVEVQKVAELILRAKSLAISTYVDPTITPRPGFQRCGYGISIYGRDRYRLFLHQLPANQNCKDFTHLTRDPAVSVTISNHVLERGILFDRAGTPPFQNGDLCEVLFIPPEPKARFVVHNQSIRDARCSPPVSPGWVSNPSVPGKIRLIAAGGALTATITVGTAGQVDF